MRLDSIKVRDFKRFADLSISGIPATAKLVLLTGPNGSGKTSLFEAFNFWMSHAKSAVHYEPEYYERGVTAVGQNWHAVLQRIDLHFHGVANSVPQDPHRKDFYIRSAYRYEAEFTTNGLGNAEDILKDARRPTRLIQQEQRVSENYQRMVGESVSALYNDPILRKKLGEEIADVLIGDVRNAVKRVFGDLVLEGPGNPMNGGTYRFAKGTSFGFHYKNLSGGEKAAFDLLLDFVVKRRAFNDTVYCIDEPELHMHTRLQAKLLEVMFDLVPENCQLWLSTHSIGIASKAVELDAASPGQVAFIDFHDRDFDQPIAMQPIRPGRRFWRRMFHTALDDLADLVVPRCVVFCEGKRLGSSGRKPSFDVDVYTTIFAPFYADVEFIPLGGTTEVRKNGDTFGLLLSKLASGIKAWKVFDRDDRHEIEVQQLQASGVQVLRRRDLESYLWDDEILRDLCESRAQPEKLAELQSEKTRALAHGVENGKASNDIKEAAGRLYNRCKQLLDLTQCGNDAEAFARLTLAPLVTPKTEVYRELEGIIMAPRRTGQVDEPQ